MEIFVASFIIIAAALVALGVGVIFGRASIRGTCGGLNLKGVGAECACSTPCERKKSRA